VALWVKIRALPAEDVATLFVADEPDDTAPLGLYFTDTGLYFERAAAGQSVESLSEGALFDTWILVAIGWDIPQNETVLFARPDGRAAFPLQRGPLPPGFALKSPAFIVTAPLGTLDEVRFFDRLLTTEELTALD
jgi:hypothetical protein